MWHGHKTNLGLISSHMQTNFKQTDFPSCTAKTVYIVFEMLANLSLEFG